MIRKFLQREGQFLLQEFGAPDARTLFRRIAFGLYFVTGTGIILGGLVALYVLFGLAAMWLGVVAIYLLHIWLLHRAPIYFGHDDFFLRGDRPPSLPPGKPALPPPSTPRLPSPSMRAITANRSHTRR